MSDVTGSEFELPHRLPAEDPAVTFGSDWNAWRSSVMPQPPKKFPRRRQRAGIRDLDLTAKEYPVAATGVGFTSGRVGLGHITASEWHEVTTPQLGAGRTIPRLGSAKPPATGGSVEVGKRES